MSLINQVLLDLEKRHASESETKPLPPYVRAVPGRQQPRMRVLVATVIALLALAAAMAYFLYRGGNASIDELLAKSVIHNATATATSTPPVATPVPISAPVATQIIAERAVQMAAFDPVSKLSDELTLAPTALSNKEKAVVPDDIPDSAVAAAKSSRPQAVKRPVSKLLQEPRIDPPAPPQPEAKTKPDLVISSDNPTRSEQAIVPPPNQAASNDGAAAAIDKRMSAVAPSEAAEISFRKGVAQIQEGRANAAELEFRDALRQDPSHAGALQALLGLLLASGRNNDAEQLLRKALEINPRQSRLAMVLARLEVERNEVVSAINTMVGVLPYVQSDADFYAFLAALLQREGRHREAVDYYREALRNVPGNGLWMMGLGISLRASNQAAEARDAFSRAIDSRQLSAELQDFVQRQLREISVAKKK